MNPILKDTRTIDNRVAEEFLHEADEAWGYGFEKKNTFIVIHPLNEEEGRKYPLVMALHSAGHGCWAGSESIGESNNHDTFKVNKEAYMVFLDDTQVGPEDYWWGGQNPQEPLDEEKLGTTPRPTERRIIGSVKWVMENYPIDDNMVYAVGVSMGGNGCLLSALPRGDIFAAIKVGVPAGARTAAERCAFGTGPANTAGIPDPPPVIEYSAQNDVWSTGHELLVNGMHEKKYLLMSYWGNFGHDASDERIPKVNDLINTFDLFSIKKNEAYPAFTDCSSDDINPWIDERGKDFSGQINAYFRWQVVEDTEDSFAMDIWLVTKEEINTSFDVPSEVTVDVTLRRLQNYYIPEGPFEFIYGDALGTAFCEDGNPTIEGLKVTNKKTTLRLKLEEDIV